jgi:hypothetical protein
MRYLLIFLMCFGLCCGAAQTCTFDGVVNNDWNDAGNWSTTVEADRVPVAGDAAVIPAGFTVVLDTPTVTCASITNGGTGTITLDLDVVADTTIVANLEVGATATVSLLSASNTGNLTVTGNLTNAGTQSGDSTIYFNATGTLTVNGNVTGGVGSQCHGISNPAATGAIVVTGTLTGGTGSFSYGILNSAASSTNTIGTIAYTPTTYSPFAGYNPILTVTTITIGGVQFGSGDSGGYRGRYN